MATKNIPFQQNMSATIKNLQTHIGQLATTVNQMQQQGSGNIPAQTIINPKGNVMQLHVELVGLGSSSSMESFAS